MTDPRPISEEELKEIQRRYPLGYMGNGDIAQLIQEVRRLQGDIAEWKYRAVGGQCKMLSLGDACDCTLCKADRRNEKLEQENSSLRSEVERLKAEKGTDKISVKIQEAPQMTENMPIACMNCIELAKELSSLRAQVERLQAAYAIAHKAMQDTDAELASTKTALEQSLHYEALFHDRLEAANKEVERLKMKVHRGNK